MHPQSARSPVVKPFRAWRIVQLFKDPTPLPGDIISVKAPSAVGVYWLAAVGRSSADGTAVRVLAVRDRRPRKFTREELEPAEEPVILSPAEMLAGIPRIVSCGPNEFWTEAEYVLTPRA